MNEAPVLLQALNLSKKFHQGDRVVAVFEQLNLDVREGESLAILGPSGSGKSTLLSLLAGLDRPTSGDVIFERHNLSRMSQDDLAELRRHRIAMVFQQFHLFQHLTAAENVALPLEITGDPQAFEKARELLGQVGLGERLDHFPTQLSGGECQRVAIARALITKPALILADEPSGSLDVRTGENVMQLLFDLVDEHKTSFILVTHNLSLAERCHRIFRFPGTMA